MIYADHAATTPCLPEAADLVRRVLVEEYGNPSSRQHASGRRARERVEEARARLAGAIGAASEEIVFTSGATESCNLAVIGVVQRLLSRRPRLVIGATEHPAVRESARACGEAGAEVVEAPVDAAGRLDLDRLRALVDDRTALVAAMLVNNETGVLHDVPAVAEIAHRHGALVLCDGTQALGRVRVDVAALGCDLLACSGHKVYGPKGAGCLWLRRGLSLAPLLHGGGQERGLRPGTENVAAIAGFGLAVERVCADLEGAHAHLAHLARLLETRLVDEVDGVRIHGADAPRAPGIVFASCPGLPRGWLSQLVGIAASSGSSCAGATGEGSHTLLAMGVRPEEAANAVRVSLGLGNDEDEVQAIAEALILGARRLRGRDVVDVD